MLSGNTMRFCTDIFGLYEDSDDSGGDSGGDSGSTAQQIKTAFFVSKTAINCTKKDIISKINITGAAGSSGSDRRFIFMIDNAYYTLKAGTGTLKAFTKEPTFANVISSGNTVATLESLTDVPGFANKKIYPIIALTAPADAAEYPSAYLSLKASSNTDTYSLTDITEIIPLADDDGDAPRITNIEVDSSCTGGGSVDVKIRFYDTLNGTPSTWSSLEDAIDREAKAVDFQITYKVTSLEDADSATLNYISLEHTLGKAVVSSDSADIYTRVVNYDNNLKVGYVILRHEPLEDATITAYVNFAKEPKVRQFLQIGNATGSTQTLTLGAGGVADTGIIASSLELYADGTPIGNFSYNSEVSTVTFKAKKAAAVTASYEYERGDEVWLKMNQTLVEPYNDVDNTVMTRYEYSLPDDYTDASALANIRLILTKRTGTVTNASYGVTTGKKQVIRLKHHYRPATLKLSDDRLAFTYDEVTGILVISSPAKDIPIKVSGKWVGVAPVIYSLVAGFSVA